MRALAVLAVLAVVTLGGAPAWVLAAPPPCTAGPPGQAAWASHGRDLANSRFQPAERGPGSVGAQNAGALRPAWVFSTGRRSGTLNGTLPEFNGTPVVSGGCVFVGGSAGVVYALDAATGRPVWSRAVGEGTPGLAGYVVGSVALTPSTVVVLVNRKGDGRSGPFAVGLRRSDGSVRWRSEPVTTQPDTYTNANPAVHDGLLVFGYSALEGDPKAQGGFAVVDADTGKVLARTPTIPPEDQARGFAGGGVWTAPAIDAAAGFAYFGTGNPYSKKSEHERTNAILKVDLRRGSPGLGRVAASYKGDIDQSEEALHTATRPTCDAAGEDRSLYEAFQRVSHPAGLHDFDGTVANSQQCGQLNLGFGAGVNLFETGGVPVVAGLHKSGRYHVVDRRTMRPVGVARLGAPGCEVCNASSTAVDDTAVYAAVMPGPVMRSMNRATFEPGWTSPVLDGAHYAAVSAANGVVYTVDGNGFLDTFDARTGAVIARHPLWVHASPDGDTAEDTVSLTAAGVAIVAGTVYVSAGSQVVAFSPGGER